MYVVVDRCVYVTPLVLNSRFCTARTEMPSVRSISPVQDMLNKGGLRIMHRGLSRIIICGIRQCGGSKISEYFCYKY